MTDLEITYLVISIVCLILSAFFTSSEIAYIKLQRIRLRHLQDSGVRGADRVARIIAPGKVSLCSTDRYQLYGNRSGSFVRFCLSL
jgi:Mg2+/Co2+ transporter CorB